MRRNSPAGATVRSRTLDRLRRKVEESVQNRADNVASGGAATHEEYRYLCGEIAGLRMVLRIMEDLHDDEEED